MVLKAIDANNATHALIADQHVEIIAKIEEGIGEAIKEGEFSCCGSFLLAKPTINTIKDHFTEIGYLIEFYNSHSKLTMITVSWDDKSLSYVQKAKNNV